MNGITPYNSGADMWRDTLSQYGEAEARKICNNYLHMQVFNKDPEEDKFCRELHAAMREAFAKNVMKPSILDELAEKKTAATQQHVSGKTQIRQAEI